MLTLIPDHHKCPVHGFSGGCRDYNVIKIENYLSTSVFSLHLPYYYFFILVD